MAKNIITPHNYQPFEELVLCSNTIINGKIPIAIDMNPVFLLGKGEPPKLWLTVPTRRNEWAYAVEEGVSKDENIRVLHSGRITAIYFKDNIIFQASKEDDSHMVITHIDLTPFGLAIKGDLSSLKVGGQQMAGNTFKNVDIMVSIK